MRRSTRVAGVVLVVLVAGSLLGAVQGTSVSQDTSEQQLSDTNAIGAAENPDSAVTPLDEHEEEGEEEDEAGATIIPEWWGLGGEAAETPYIGLVELGVVLLVVGVGGYSLGKRTSLVPLKYRKRLLQAHEWTVLVGTALVAPHFFAVEEWEGLGFLVGVLLAIEVASGLYGRHLHRHVIRLNRGDEHAPILGRVIELSKRSVLSRWRRVHVLLTLVTGVVLVLHIVTAIGD